MHKYLLKHHRVHVVIRSRYRVPPHYYCLSPADRQTWAGLWHPLHTPASQAKETVLLPNTLSVCSQNAGQCCRFTPCEWEQNENHHLLNCSETASKNQRALQKKFKTHLQVISRFIFKMWHAHKQNYFYLHAGNRSLLQANSYTAVYIVSLCTNYEYLRNPSIFLSSTVRVFHLHI